MALYSLRCFNQKGRGCFVSSIFRHTPYAVKRIDEIVFDDNRKNIMHGDLQFGANDFITSTFSARSSMWCTACVHCTLNDVKADGIWFPNGNVLVARSTFWFWPWKHTTTDNVNRSKLHFFSLRLLSVNFIIDSNHNTHIPHPYLQTSVQAVTKQQLLLLSPQWGSHSNRRKTASTFPFFAPFTYSYYCTKENLSPFPFPFPEPTKAHALTVWWWMFGKLLNCWFLVRISLVEGSAIDWAIKFAEHVKTNPAPLGSLTYRFFIQLLNR